MTNIYSFKIISHDLQYVFSVRHRSINYDQKVNAPIPLIYLKNNIHFTIEIAE